MKIRLRLLPHWCQVLGYTYCFIFLIVCCLLQILTSVAPDGVVTGYVLDFLAPVMENREIVGLFNYAMLIMAAFSRETVEDEVMLMLRLRSLVIIVVLNFLLAIASFALPDVSQAEYIVDAVRDFVASDFALVMLLYVVIFKVSVWIHRLRSL